MRSLQWAHLSTEWVFNKCVFYYHYCYYDYCYNSHQAFTLPLSHYIPHHDYNTISLKHCLRTSTVVQWLRLCTPNAGGRGSIPGQGTRVHMLQLKEPVCLNQA